jgi:signal transduction histidine kinase/DNA-binding response OmpR family regulator
MIHSDFDLRSVETPALTTTARRTIARLAFVAISATLVVTTAGAIAIWSLTDGLNENRAVVFIGASLISGLIFAVVAAFALGRLFAVPASRAADLLMSYLIMAGEDPTTDINLHNARGMSVSAIMKDFDRLEQRVAKVVARSQGVIAELERAREHANLQNLAKSQFLANMSHELRTPLNAILGYAMLLSEDAIEAKNEPVVADLDRIQQAGRHLLSLINEILDLSKIEAGKATLDRTVVDINALVRSAAITYDADTKRNGNSFTVDVDPEIGIMIGDEAKIRQCLTNLLSNAFKFTSNGTVALDVRIVEAAGKSDVVFTVNDSGIGIAADQMDTLFEPFRQGDGSSSRKFGGTGLGLAIARRLARMMLGDLTVESIVGKGTVFTLAVPLNAGTTSIFDEARAAGQAPSVESVVQSVEGYERTALIIDDSDSAIDLMRRWLTRMNYGVVSATDGEAGLALARAQKPDLILLDVLMPGRSGYDILEELRADDALGSTPVILVTVDDDRARGLEAGATDYIRKPVAESQLRAMLEVYATKASGEILIIEDDDDAAELVDRCARQVGFSTRRATDGAQGLAMATAQPPIAIVLDLAMPNFNGFQVIDALLANEALRSLPVIVLSACEISLEEHRRIVDAGYLFCAKGSSSPREIAQHLKELVR